MSGQVWTISTNLPCSKAKSWGKKSRILTIIVEHLLTPSHQATTHTKWVSFLRLTTQGLILLLPFASNHSPLACLLDTIYAGLNIWHTLEQIELPKLGNLWLCTPSFTHSSLVWDALKAHYPCLRCKLLPWKISLFTWGETSYKWIVGRG